MLMKPLDKITLRTLIKAVVETHDDEIDCNECFEQMSRFAELALEGKSPEKAMPLVQDHLKKMRGLSRRVSNTVRSIAGG